MVNSNIVFWGEIAASDHFLQLYEDDEIFLDGLEAYVCAGIAKSESVIIIATTEHLSALEKRLINYYNLNKLIIQKHYMPIDVEVILDKILINSQIDAALFNTEMSNLMKSINRDSNNTIRVFGEIVAVLWGQGNRKAVYELEKLWHEYCKKEKICLYCAYPKAGFIQDSIQSVQHICDCHNNLVDDSGFTTQIDFYGSKLSISSFA